MTDHTSPAAVVVGGSRGLGRAIACRLVATGWSTTVIGRRKRGEALLPDEVAYTQMDLARADGADRLLEILTAVRPRLVVYNAALYGQRAAALPTDEQMVELFRTNAFTPFRALHRFLQQPPVPAGCSVVLVNSDAIYHANRHSGVYAASKAALRVLTAALADTCRGTPSRVSTLLVGPLMDDRKEAEFAALAERLQSDARTVEAQFLRRSNPAFVVDRLISVDDAVEALLGIVRLGPSANGMVLRLDGGSSGSLG